MPRGNLYQLHESFLRLHTTVSGDMMDSGASYFFEAASIDVPGEFLLSCCTNVDKLRHGTRSFPKRTDCSSLSPDAVIQPKRSQIIGRLNHSFRKSTMHQSGDHLTKENGKMMVRTEKDFALGRTRPADAVHQIRALWFVGAAGYFSLEAKYEWLVRQVTN